MKKTLLLITLLVTSYNLFAFTTQGVWRWRNDDGSETGATWKADQNTPITIYSSDSVIRLRIELYNNGSGGVLDNAVFEDSSNEAGSHWTRIFDTSESNAFKLAGSSPFVTDLEPTTHQLNGQPIPPYTFAAGKMIIISDSLPKQTLASGETSEFEYAFKPTSNIKTSVTYYFRVDAATYPIGYTYPSLTTAAVLAVNFSAFNLQQDKNGVQISWATASEQNNNHFDIERSSNGSVFTKIATVKGNNTSTTVSSYSVYDNKPLNGVNYYRLKQVDNDGKVTTSVIKSISISGQHVIIKAYPNPTHGDISFTLNNYNSNAVTATLNNVSGKTIHQELIQLNGSNSYKLNLQNKLPAGVYFLQLKGEALTENIKVVVQ